MGPRTGPESRRSRVPNWFSNKGLAVAPVADTLGFVVPPWEGEVNKLANGFDGPTSRRVGQFQLAAQDGPQFEGFFHPLFNLGFGTIAVQGDEVEHDNVSVVVLGFRGVS